MAVKRSSAVGAVPLLLAGALLPACGADNADRAGGAPTITATSTASPVPSRTRTSPPTTPPTSEPPTSSPSGSRTHSSSGHRVLTLADSGKTVVLAVGESVSVRLGGPWLWHDLTVDGGAIDAAQVNFLVDPGYSEWGVRGVRAGRATLQINGDANCPANAVCIIGDKVFALTFTVG